LENLYNKTNYILVENESTRKISIYFAWSIVL